MIPPSQLRFDGFTMNTNDLEISSNDHAMCPSAWLRVHFQIPDSWNAPEKVTAWLEKNCKHKWRTYHYYNPKKKDENYIMVVRFENKDDALLFKLMGGHQAWQS